MTSDALPEFLRLDGRSVTLVLSLAGGIPVAIHWGARLADTADLAAVLRLGLRGATHASPAVPAPLALSPLAGSGFPGRPGLAAHRDGRDWAHHAVLTHIESAPGMLRLFASDPVHHVDLEHHLQLAGDGDVLVATTRITNSGTAPLQVAQLAAPCLPVTAQADTIIGFEGRWSGEFQTYRLPRQPGSWVRENRRGRTSHDSFPAMILAEAGSSESQGAAWGYHLGWSGNHRLAVETLSDGRAFAALEALYLPGEIILAPGESLSTPALYAGFSVSGLNGLSEGFHRHLRNRPEHARLRAKPRPVHFNSWEAVYFDHDPAVLMDLASRAAAVGAERFILDDGWFLGRRHDRAGLGDWTVDRSVYPHGLGPLVRHVTGLGMEFGLWVEPEMVNPDSELCRAHPDWVLATPPAPSLDYRHQQVLDFSRADVCGHVHAALDALLQEYPISYLKWDMNRDISHPGGADGRPVAKAHVEGVYALLQRLRHDHPCVEIESCASGGGRADYGILGLTDRIWTSDSNDARDRLAIQRGFSHFFPAEVMGSHVGPSPCHITGRRLSMDLRVATALFGHMGMELDLRRLNDRDTATLAAGIALHKQHRTLIHGGRLWRCDAADGVNAFLVVDDDQQSALLSYTVINEQRGYFPAPLRIPGLQPGRDYCLTCVWPPVPPAGLQPFVASGALLATIGWLPPILPPETALVFTIVAKQHDG